MVNYPFLNLLKNFVFLTSLFIVACTNQLIPNEKACIPIKNIHFTPAQFLLKDICVYGKVISIGKYNTYLEVKDHTGILVANLANIVKDIPNYVNKNIFINGKVQIGQMGIPYIVADEYHVK